MTDFEYSTLSNLLRAYGMAEICSALGDMADGLAEDRRDAGNSVAAARLETERDAAWTAMRTLSE